MSCFVCVRGVWGNKSLLAFLLDNRRFYVISRECGGVGQAGLESWICPLLDSFFFPEVTALAAERKKETARKDRAGLPIDVSVAFEYK